jgi:hypothetical protein
VDATRGILGVVEHALGFSVLPSDPMTRRAP